MPRDKPVKDADNPPPENSEFSALLGRARAGDSTALEALIHRAQPRLQSRAARTLGQWLRTRTRKSDVVQDALLEVVRSFGLFVGNTESAFVVWVERIVSTSAQRQKRYFGASKRGGRLDTPNASELDALSVDARTPSAVAIGAEAVAAYRRALESLTEDQRHAFEQVVLAGRPIAEVASEMRRNAAALHALLGRARATLTLRLEREGLGGQPPKPSA